MYIYPVQLQKFSNREDFLLTLALYDDDTGSAINLDGTALAIPGVPFTSNAWTVTDGAIVTTSSTSITIPAYPIGSQLQSLSLTVGLNLGILAGDPIFIKDTATGKNTMTGYVISYAPTSGALVVQIGQAFFFEIRKWRRGAQGGRTILDGGYSPFYDIGTTNDEGPILSASMGNGITITDVGFIQIFIPAAVFGKLHEQTYLVGLTMTDSINTRQIFIGELPVQWGAVSRQGATNLQNSAWSNIF
jgi:hypothetical protein